MDDLHIFVVPVSGPKPVEDCAYLLQYPGVFESELAELSDEYHHLRKLIDDRLYF